MAKAINKRRALFNKFSNQLLLLKEHGILNINFVNDKPYLCPICLIEFSEKDLVDDPTKNFLTLEDTPPDSLGGTKLALTCKNCNSECGHKIDAHLTNAVRAVDASYFYKGQKQHTTIEFEGKKISVELTSLGNGTFKAYHRIKQNNPTLLEKFIYGIKNKTIGPLLNFDSPKYTFDSKRVNYALIKTLYIMTFSKFGYIFLLDKEYDGIRNQLLQPELDIYPYAPFIKNQFPASAIDTYYVLDKKIESIFTIFSLRTEYSETLIAGLLPLPANNIETFTKEIDYRKDQNNELTINTTRYDPAADLFNDINQINIIVKWITGTTPAS